MEGDVRGAVHQILSKAANASGNLAFMRLYEAAPNPTIVVDGLGMIGLPLSARAAEDMKNHVVVRDAATCGRRSMPQADWEIDADKIRIENLEWPAFISETMNRICDVLGVSVEAVRPQCELQKLALSACGSRSPFGVEPETGEGAFASLVVILPSRFTGGTLHVAHHDHEEIYDSDNDSIANTTILSWYASARLEAEPIVSGHRVALCYTIRATVPPYPSVLDEDIDTSTRLRHVFKSWSQAQGQEHTPEKVVHVLNHKYSSEDLNGDVLKGEDARLVSLVKNTAKPYGFHLALGNLTCTLRGTNASGYPSKSFDGASEDSEPEEGLCDDLNIDGIDKTLAAIEGFVDLEGHSVTRASPEAVDIERDVLPAGLVGTLVNGQSDRCGLRYEYVDEVSLQRVFNRTALIIWPQWKRA